jgi:hypothetical protein
VIEASRLPGLQGLDMALLSEETGRSLTEPLRKDRRPPQFRDDRWTGSTPSARGHPFGTLQ